MRKPPSEAVQVSAQIFAIEMARHVSKRDGADINAELKSSIRETRNCMDGLGLTDPIHTNTKENNNA